MHYAKIVTTAGVYYCDPPPSGAPRHIQQKINDHKEIAVHPHGMRGGIDGDTTLLIVFNPAHVVSVSVDRDVP